MFLWLSDLYAHRACFVELKLESPCWWWASNSSLCTKGFMAVATRRFQCILVAVWVYVVDELAIQRKPKYA